MTNYSKHYSVMNKDVLKYLHDHFSKDDELVVSDLTFGAGGHTLKIASDFKNAKLICFDQDPEAFANGQKLIEENGFQKRINLIYSNFESFSNHDLVQSNQFNLILMDLGVSSHHFDDQKRGFSFRFDADLDMRMNTNDSSIETASDLINNLREEEIADLIYEYGEERYSRRIAAKIVEERSKRKITTTKQLEEICFSSYPARERHKRIHPATKTFQALRIAVNRELDVLQNTLPILFDKLKDNGMIIVISFHSLEDRIVKHTFKDIFQSHKNTAKIITKRPQLPSEEEIMENPRSRSAKMRVLQKTAPGGNFSGKKKEKRK